MKYKLKFDREHWGTIYSLGLDVWVPRNPNRSTVLKVTTYCWKHSVSVTILDREIYNKETAILDGTYDY